LLNTSLDWEKAAQHLDQLYEASEGLEALFPGRKFTLDGHLVGSVGEVVAAYIFDLDLNTASTMGHDAVSACSKNVEIKLTQGRSIGIRHEPEHMIALHRPKGGPVRIVFNGPGSIAWEHAGKLQSNGQRPISIARLLKLDQRIRDSERLPVIRETPI